jgi:hypothetical protein
LDLSEKDKERIIKKIINFPKADLDGYFHGIYLYVTMNGQPLCRLEHVEDDLWYFAIYKWSNGKYSKDEFGFNQKPLPLSEQLDFAVRVRS